jgi:hypothetical protein
MNRSSIDAGRRELIQSMGMLTGVLAAGSPLALLAPGRVWAADLTSLTSAEGAMLMAVARTIAPHDKLEDAAYAVVIKAIDGVVKNDAPLLKVIQDGVKQMPAGFAKADEATRVAALRRIESTLSFRHCADTR